MSEHLEESIPADTDLWPQVQRKLTRRRRQRLLMRMASAAAAAVIVVGAGVTWSLWPGTANAQVILEKAQATLASPAALRSFVMTERVTWRTQATEIQRWYQAPDHWRTETRQDGQLVAVTASDGTDLWRYDPASHTATVSAGGGDYNMVETLSPFGQAVSDLTDLFRQAGQPGQCLTPKVKGTEAVAGRQAYVLDLGATSCPSTSAPDLNGRQTMWVDKETYLVLKVTYEAPDGSLAGFREVTSLQLGVDVAPERFTFAPPVGAVVYDARPKPAPTVAEFRTQMQQMAAQLDYPLFAPRAIPAGLRPGAPMKTSAADVARNVPNEVPLMVGGNRAWFLAGGTLPSGSGRLANGLTLIRDGTFINFTSFGLGKEALLQMATSLEPVPGGHAALPNPVPLTIKEIRTRVPYPVLLPGRVPPGLKPGLPVANTTVHVPYQSEKGTVELDVLNGPAGCCLDGDGRKAVNPVVIRGGITAYFLNIEPQYGGPILWWNENGAYVALSGPNQTKASLLEIAESMSPTAE